MLAGCGGKKAIPNQLPTTTADEDGCHAIAEVPNPAQRARAEAEDGARPGEDLRRDARRRTAAASRSGSTRRPRRTRRRRSSALVRRGFFLQTIFHRIVPGFVIQGGDPTGTGTSGPGYTTIDTPREVDDVPGRRRSRWRRGGSQPRGAAGSQFFIVISQPARAAAGLRRDRPRHEGPGRGRSGSGSSATRTPAHRSGSS